MQTSTLVLSSLQDPSYCRDRGYHGPFVNMERYAGDPWWDGMGECSVCGSTATARPRGSAVRARAASRFGPEAY